MMRVPRGEALQTTIVKNLFFLVSNAQIKFGLLFVDLFLCSVLWVHLYPTPTCLGLDVVVVLIY
jgi:hypothetical protein